MLRQLKSISIFLLLFLVFLSSIVFAQTTIGKFTFVQGRVDVLRAPATRAVPVKIGDAVFVGDIIRAKSNSKAEIAFSDGNVVKIAPNTRMEISEYMFEEAKGKGILKLSRGKVQAIVQQKIAKKIASFGEANRFEIHTPTAIAGVRGTNFIVSFQRNSTNVLVLEGSVNTYNPKFPDMAVTLTAGYITTIPLDQPPQPARLATDAEKNMYKGDFTPGESGGKSDTEDTVISEATTGATGPGAPEEPPAPPAPPAPITPETPPITETFGVDTTPPVITISGPPLLTNLRDAIFNVSSDETVTFTYIIDNNVVVVSPNTSLDNFIIPDLTDGNHVVTVIATDQAGNKTTLEYIWTVDATGPVVTIIPPKASPGDNSTANIEVTLISNETASYAYSYSLDGMKGTGTEPFINILNISEGSHTLNIDVQAKDGLGNPSSTSKSYNFGLSRYSLTGSFYGCIGGVYGTVTGEVAGVSNKDWGGWKIEMSGSGGYPNPSWTVTAGGRSSDNIETNNHGYWLLIADGSSDYNSKLSGTSALKYLSQDRLGFGQGTLSGNYLCVEGCSYELTDIGSGSYTEVPLDFGGSMSGSFMYWDEEMRDIPSGGIIQGLIGGTNSLWNGSPSFISLGTYEGRDENRLWGIDIGTEEISGWNIGDGSFLGTTGGIILNNNLEGLAIGIYIKPYDDGYETGYIYSENVRGLLYPEIGMYELGGNLTAVSMGTTTIAPSELSLSLNFGEKELMTISGDINGFIKIEGINLNDQNWGVWRAGSGGTFDSITSDRWKATLSNIEYGEEGIVGYTLANLIGTDWSDGRLASTVNGKFVNMDTMGIFSGSLIGIYTQDDGNFWEAVGGGTYIEAPLVFGGITIGSFMYWNGELIEIPPIEIVQEPFGETELLQMDLSYFLLNEDRSFCPVEYANLTGLMGVAEIDGLQSFLSLGTYNADYETGNLYDGVLWGMVIEDFIPDNDALIGITGGIVLNDSLEGKLFAIYLKATEMEGQNEIGYISSNNETGLIYPEIGMYELAGNVTDISIGTIYISPSELYWGSESLYASMGYGNIEGDLEGSIGVQNIGFLQNIGDESQLWGMGIWSGIYYSEENKPIPSIWRASVDGEIYSGEVYRLIYEEEVPNLDSVVGYWGNQIIGNRIDTGNKLIGTSVGYLADISSTPFTAVSAGETIGTFNPNDYTWQAVSMGVWIETNKFLEMASTPEGIAKLQQLNIPCFEVGRATLTQHTTNEYLSNVHMNNVIFFAPNTNARPSIWATGDVGGSYSGNPINQTIGLLGNGLSANFNVQHWDTVNNKWLSTITDGRGSITGGGPNVQTLNFHGAAAGTINQGSGQFSGTAAGVAR
jgi:hypothetical protein